MAATPYNTFIIPSPGNVTVELDNNTYHNIPVGKAQCLTIRAAMKAIPAQNAGAPPVTPLNNKYPAIEFVMVENKTYTWILPDIATRDTQLALIRIS